MLINLGSKDGVKKATELLNKLIKKGCWVDLTEKRKQRTLQQNKYLHVCLTIFSVNQGYSIQELKTIFAHQIAFMTYEISDFDGSKIINVRSTSDLSDLECNFYIDKLRLTASEMGCYIPTSEEYLQSKHQYDSELEKTELYQ